MGRVIRIVLLVLLLSILVLVIWLRQTPEGRDLAEELSHRWRQSQRSQHSGEERDAIEKLTAMGARFVRSAPPEQYYVSINCNDKTLGDEGYRLVAKCRRLESAIFIRCDLNDERMRYLAGLSDLTSLSIVDIPAVTDAGIKHVAALQNLVGLLLTGTSVADAGLAEIGKLPELATLDLSHTRITDAGLPALNGLGKLQWLVLIGTAVTDDGVAKLNGLSSLRQITLKGSRVTDKGKAQLLKMHPGLTID